MCILLHKCNAWLIKAKNVIFFLYLTGQEKLLALSNYTTFQKNTISYATASLKLGGFQIHVK